MQQDDADRTGGKSRQAAEQEQRCQAQEAAANEIHSWIDAPLVRPPGASDLRSVRGRGLLLRRVGRAFMGQEVARQRHRIGKAGASQGDAIGKGTRQA